ncbi:hypothetical protein [Luethyella okanaganae]|uniref:Secreted protein n=1 Tax=Luethyella okanaganae TaxID=69372 RepID=A0ABW1VH31_9MICO
MAERSEISMQRRTKGLLVSAALAAGLVFGAAAPASSATYTWLDKSVSPNGTTYSDSGTGAASFSRTGVSAKIDGADGYTWETRVSYNGYWSGGQASATQNGPRGWGTTYAKFTFLPDPSDPGNVDVSAWLLDAQLGRVAAPGLLDAVEGGSELAPPASAEITAEQLRAGEAPGFDLAYYGVADTSDIWSGSTADGETCLFVAQGEYVGSTCADATQFENYGLSFLSQGPSHSIQVALAPHGGITEEAAQVVGLERITDSLAVNTGEPVKGTLVLDNTQSRSIGAAGIVLVPAEQ